MSLKGAFCSVLLNASSYWNVWSMLLNGNGGNLVKFKEGILMVHGKWYIEYIFNENTRMSFIFVAFIIRQNRQKLAAKFSRIIFGLKF